MQRPSHVTAAPSPLTGPDSALEPTPGTRRVSAILTLPVGPERSVARHEPPEEPDGVDGRDGDRAALMFHALATLPMVRDYGAAFTQVTGLPLKLLATDSPLMAVPLGASHSPFCALLGRIPNGCSLCAKVHAAVQQQAVASLEPRQACCFAGMPYVAVPVVVNRQPVATLVAGQVLCEKPTRQSFHRVARQLLASGVETDFAALGKSYLSSRVIAAPEFAAMVRMLTIFAEHLAQFASHGLLQWRASDPPRVALAKDFAQQHAAESIAMPDAAHHVHLSSCYFCKMFRKSTGITFTEYISRVRVEKALVLLADEHKRVSEVAFDSGFESIPHFNRVFKRYAGMAPSDYRASLAQPASGVVRH